MNPIIKTGKPGREGMYVAFCEPKISEFPFTERKMLMWVDGKWGYLSSDQYYRGIVFGWIGPLPVAKVDDFKEKENVAYAIGTKVGARSGQFTDGPFILLNQVFEHAGAAGRFIFKLTPDAKCIPIARWSPYGWRKLKKRK